MGPIN